MIIVVDGWQREKTGLLFANEEPKGLNELLSSEETRECVDRWESVTKKVCGNSVARTDSKVVIGDEDEDEDDEGSIDPSI